MINSRHLRYYSGHLSLYKKMKFSMKVSSVNVTKSAGNCGFVTFTKKILNGKLHFWCSVYYLRN